MIDGAKQLPTQHVSIRVPWHDRAWDGHVCDNPLANTQCLALRLIGETRDDDWEAARAGTPYSEEEGRLPACAAERGAFMSPRGYKRRVDHPYRWGKSHGHFRPTTFQHAPWSAAAIPFGWMLREGGADFPEPATRLGLGVQPQWEPNLGFQTSWVQDRRNQLVMLDTFFGAIRPQESLVAFYAKRTPLTDDPRRVIVGLGRVTHIGEPVEYATEGAAPDALRSMLWERNVHHSIRPEAGDGFLLPYHEILRLAVADPSLDVESLVLYAPEEHWDSFSMGSAHVTHDGMIAVLIAASGVLERIAAVVPGPWAEARAWVDAELNRLWRLRGAYPGLGSALTAFGVPNGTLVAHAVAGMLGTDGDAPPKDPWPLVDQVLARPSLLPAAFGAALGPVKAKEWAGLPEPRKALLRLLARFEISADQATRWWVKEERQKAGISLADDAILANPYLCYEADRGRTDAIPFALIDRGLFADKVVLDALPIPTPSACAEATDPRRVRALMVQALERAGGEGHTLLSQDELVLRVRAEEVSPPCPITGDWVAGFEDALGPVLVKARAGKDAAAWQLDRYVVTRQLIAEFVRTRVKGVAHKGTHDWAELIDAAIRSTGAPPLDPTDFDEVAARKEKAEALEVLYRRRFSALIGPAGTGKTTLLSALLSIPEIASGGVLLLAPTGKARVQMQSKAQTTTALTLAQFLLASKRYDGQTGRYLVKGAANREEGYATVVIDEASMLTEEMLAATLDALAPNRVSRLILVGDPRQLPPIGAGRPFRDIIGYLESQPESVKSPGVAHFGRLTIPRRQTGVDDVVLARWFAEGAPDPGSDEIWSKLATGSAQGVRAVRWDSEVELTQKLREEIVSYVRSRPGADPAWTEELAFEASLGGTVSNGRAYFNRGAGEKAEAWQILSPLRGGQIGVDGINRWVRKDFRPSVWSWAQPEKYYWRKIAEPMGRQALLYGDKVINLANGRRKEVWPEKDKPYLANGEIGLAVGQFKGPNWRPKGLPWQLQVEFTTQPGYAYAFTEADFGDEGEDRLELAYALTIHKSQGSEFGTTFVILPNPCRVLSRELIYTALTRQKGSVVLLHQGELHTLRNLSRDDKSDTARRWTNLLADPDPVEAGGTFYEAGLVHLTRRGELVRSKSEKIIANELDHMGLPYVYETPFEGRDGTVRYPDFTIDRGDGRIILIEHLGMLDRADYTARWEAKRAWYATSGVGELGDEDAKVWLLETREGQDFEAQMAAALKDALGLV